MAKLRIAGALVAAGVLVAGAMLVATGHAQNTISVASTLVPAGSAVPGACRDQVAVLQRVLSLFPRPDQWHWVVVCDDTAWRRFLLNSVTANADMKGIPAAEGGTIYASTDIDAHLTCVRGTTLLQPDSPLAQAKDVIAHELAHILLNTRDESRADRQAALWLRDRKRQ